MRLLVKFTAIILISLGTVYANPTDLSSPRTVNSKTETAKQKIVQLYVDNEITKEEALRLLKEQKTTNSLNDSFSTKSLKRSSNETSSENTDIKQKLRISRIKLEGVTKEILALENQLENNNFNNYSSKSSNIKPIANSDDFTSQTPKDSGGQGNYRTLLGSSYYLFGFMRDTEDTLEYERHSIKVAQSLKMHQNFNLNYDFFFGKSNWVNKYWYASDPERIFTEEKTATDFGFNFGARYHLPIQLENKVLRVISPFISAKMGYEYRIGDQMVGIPGTSISFTPVGNIWPWHLKLGTELLLFDSFSIIPYFDYSSAFASDLDSSTMLGLDFVYFLSNRFALKAGYMTGADKGKLDRQFVIQH